MYILFIRVLPAVPWRVAEEEASVLILPEDGSAGLDLSFATHLFLLEKIRDPALVCCMHQLTINFISEL